MSTTGVSAGDELPGPDGRDPLLGDNASTGRLGDRIFGGVANAAGLTVIVIVALVGIFLTVKAIPALSDNTVNFFTYRDFATSPQLKFGILQLLWTTVMSSLVALAIAVPFSVAIALFLTHYSPRWLRGPAAALIDLLAAVPSIVYGIWGAYVVAPKFTPVQDAIQSVLGWIPLFGKVAGISGGTIFLVGIVLAIMILPIITALTREVFAQTPTAHKEGAIALGATKWEMIRTAVIPFGRPGMISASMLGLGRALGETIAVLTILSTLPDGSKWAWSLFNGGSTFASIIANNAPETINDIHQMGAYIAAGLVLFVLTFVVNAIARVIIERRKEFSE